MEVKKGIDIILLYRLLEDAKKEYAWKLAFQTEHENEISRDTDGVATKDGTVQSLQAVEYDFSATSLLAKGDKAVKKLKQAMLEGKVVEIWEIDRSEKGTDVNSEKYAATYYQGYITSYSVSANAEDNVELELEFGINGIGQEGYATLTEDQKKVVQYAFEDTTTKQD